MDIVFHAGKSTVVEDPFGTLLKDSDGIQIE